MRPKRKDNAGTCPTVHHHNESVRMSHSASQFCRTSSYQSSRLFFTAEVFCFIFDLLIFFIQPMPDSFAKLYERLIPAAILF